MTKLDETVTHWRKKPVVIEAARWRKNGDHPADNAWEMFDYPDGCQRPRVIREGAVVRYYRRPDDDGERPCQHCAVRMHDHGWIDTLEGGHVVCPGDWIITGVAGEIYPCKPAIFEATYEPVQPAVFWWRDHEDEALTTLAEAMEGVEPLEVRRVWKGPEGKNSKAVFVVPVEIDTDGDGIADDSEIREFPSYELAAAFVADVRAAAGPEAP